MLRRMGIFFIIVGILILLFAVSSGELNNENLRLYCISTPLMVLGVFLWYRNRDRTPVERFRTVRKIASRRRKDEEEETLD